MIESPHADPDRRRPVYPAHGARGKLNDSLDPIAMLEKAARLALADTGAGERADRGDRYRFRRAVHGGFVGCRARLPNAACSAIRPCR